MYRITYTTKSGLVATYNQNGKWSLYEREKAELYETEMAAKAIVSTWIAVQMTPEALERVNVEQIGN